MWARVSHYTGPVENIHDGDEYARQKIVPELRTLAGYRGVYSLADRTTGRTLSITLWGTEEALRASEEAADRMRRDTTDRASGEIVSVERYEVTFHDIP